MRALILVGSAALALAACGDPPAENSPVEPVATCEGDEANCVVSDNEVTRPDQNVPEGTQIP